MQVPQCGYCQSGQIMAAAALIRQEAMIEALQVESARWQTRAEQKDGEVQAAVAEQTARVRAEFLAEKENLLRQIQTARQELARLNEQLSAKGQTDAGAAGERDALQRRVGELLAQVESLHQQLTAARTMHGAELAGLQAQLAAAKGSTQELQALSRARDAAAAQNSELQAELARVQAALAEAHAAGGTAAAGNRGVQDQVNELKRTNRDLRNELEILQQKFAAGGPEPAASPTGPSPAQTQELTDLRRLFEQAQSARRTAEVLKERADSELREMREKLATGATAVSSATAPAASAAAHAEYAALKAEAVRVYEDINDIASELKNNVELAQTYAADLRDGRDTQSNLDATDEVLSTLKDAADTFKKTLRRFREVLQRHGYEG